MAMAMWPFRFFPRGKIRARQVLPGVLYSRRGVEPFPPMLRILNDERKLRIAHVLLISGVCN